MQLVLDYKIKHKAKRGPELHYKVDVSAVVSTWVCFFGVLCVDNKSTRNKRDKREYRIIPITVKKVGSEGAASGERRLTL